MNSSWRQAKNSCLDKVMNYLYKDNDGKIITGEITYLHITPFYEFEIEIDGCRLNCYLDHLLSGWHLCFAGYDIDVELEDPENVSSNAEAVYDKLGDEDASLMIAYAVKAVYLEKDYSRDVL